MIHLTDLTAAMGKDKKNNCVNVYFVLYGHRERKAFIFLYLPY